MMEDENDSDAAGDERPFLSESQNAEATKLMEARKRFYEEKELHDIGLDRDGKSKKNKALEAKSDETMVDIASEHHKSYTLDWPGGTGKDEFGPFSKHISRVNQYCFRIARDFVPNMKVEGLVFANEDLTRMLMSEVLRSLSESQRAEVMKALDTRNAEAQLLLGCKHGVTLGSGGFTPALEQVANVATLPGIVTVSLAMPDIHSGYGFAIGSVCAMDADDPAAIVSPGGVGYDINCGVRLIRTNLRRSELTAGNIFALADAIKARVHVGVGSSKNLKITSEKLDRILNEGAPSLLEDGQVWEEDLPHMESGGCIPGAKADCVGKRAKQRGLNQCGSLGSGNHYVEIQVVKEIRDPISCAALKLVEDQIVIMIHSGSRGLGHQVCSDTVQIVQEHSAAQSITWNDKQLAGVPISSPAGQKYLSAMNAAANFAFCNRSILTTHVRNAFQAVLGKTPRELDMHLVYDVAHNIAKLEEHIVNGNRRRLLVHRKGATRAFPPHHPDIPEDYKEIGQPVFIGGSMGTESYVLVGLPTSMVYSFGSTCHGAGRAKSRSQALRDQTSEQVKNEMNRLGVEFRVGNPNDIAEESAQSYKDVSAVVETCEQAGLSKRVAMMKPVAVIKG